MVGKKQDYVYPEVNIGLVGHVDHGKTTLTERLSGKWTDTHSEELRRGITIRLGYADATFYKIPGREGVEAYTTQPETDGRKNILLRKVSFLDAPGHESLMATMLAGTALMDGALLLIAANEPCPQPQTREHLMALQIIGVKHVIIVQNKIDLVTPDEARKNYEQIKAFLKGTPYEDAPVIPISAQQGVNIDALIAAIQAYIPTPERDPNATPVLHIARSFDINKPGITPGELKGGVLGGAVRQGRFRIGDEIEILPGIRVEEKNRATWQPLRTRIIALRAGETEVDEIRPGGSVGVQTELDPTLVKADRLAGSLAAPPGVLPQPVSSLTLEVHLLERVVGAKDDLIVEPLKLREPLVLNIHTATTVGVITQLGKDEVTVMLKRPVIATPGEKVTLSRRFKDRWRLIGYGIVKEA